MDDKNEVKTEDKEKEIVDLQNEQEEKDKKKISELLILIVELILIFMCAFGVYILIRDYLIQYFI